MYKKNFILLNIYFLPNSIIFKEYSVWRIIGHIIYSYLSNLCRSNRRRCNSYEIDISISP